MLAPYPSRIPLPLRLLFAAVNPGLLNEDGTINNAASIARLAEIARVYAEAGKMVLLLCQPHFCIVVFLKERMCVVFCAL